MRRTIGLLSVFAVMLAVVAAVLVRSPVAYQSAATANLQGTGTLIAIDYMSFALGFAGGITVMWIYGLKALPRALLGLAAAVAVFFMLY